MFKNLISLFQRPSRLALRGELASVLSDLRIRDGELESWKKSANSLHESLRRSLIREKKLHRMIYTYDGTVQDAIKAIRRTAPKVSESLKVARHEFFNALRDLKEKG